jgi:hypothetical protein
VEFSRDGNTVTATLTGTTLQSEEHNFGILTLDADTGIPVGMNYTFFTEQMPETGTVQTVTLDMSDAETIPDDLRVYLMVDAYPAAVETLSAGN